ncbi:MAG TPA: Hpt domain-containing protein [Thermoanaerobaculia bacterium]|jgi:HPt (histidine-containing phosphotransfer) domain-containing protein
MVVDYELNELKREFLDEAREKIAEMQSALDSVSLERVAYLAHQLKGSGGSYGYQRISTDAAELEKCVEASSPDDARIQQFVVSLRAEIDRAAKELTLA